MTTRHKGYVVALAEDVREDDAERVITALRMVKGVLNVTPIEAVHDDWIVEERVRQDLHKQIFEIAYPKKRNER